ncbi:MarR family winged helix-turn-helix transcriptional regulator [Paenibacillus sp. GCM10028914]|uniref:MarR family winged helix-turn-helix transcriptional regulator n=1 Tax=Paenibacillus sp. GCM10028914 TaxID=3273416 RepID=UPI00361F39F7
MDNILNNDLIANWLTLTHIQMNVTNELEANLQAKHGLSINEFYLLLFLSEAPEKKLKLQKLESMVGLSQSAISRLVSRFEAKGCGALERKACDDDRRSIYTALTSIGEDKLIRAQETFKDTLIKSFPEKDVEELLKQMIQLKKL